MVKIEMYLLWLRVAAILYAAGAVAVFPAVLYKVDRWRRWCVHLGGMAWFFHFVSAVEMLAGAHRWVPVGVREVQSLMGLAVISVFFLVWWLYDAISLGLFALPATFFLVLIPALGPDRYTFPSQRVRTSWLVAHIAALLLAYVALGFSLLASILYLVQERRLKAKPKARFLTADKIAAWREENSANLDATQRNDIDDLLGMMAKNSLQPKMNGIIGELIQAAALVPAKNFMTPQTRRYAYQLTRRPEAVARIKLHKQLAKHLVYRSGALHQIEFKGGNMLRKLAAALFANYFDEATPLVLTPSDVHRAVLGAEDKAAKARLLCDHLSGMTDAYAVRSYKRLLDPDYGSISELI